MITLYTTHCPKCTVLEKKLRAKNIPYNICEDREIMKIMGFAFLPVLQVDDKTYNFTEAVEYVNNMR